MSGPITQADALPSIEIPTSPDGPAFVLFRPRHSVVGGTDVKRTLPKRQRRTIGAWCFADHFGPEDLDDKPGMEVGPHPHIGLQTATWLLAGELIHRDSLGSEQRIRQGELNLMTAGKGVRLGDILDLAGVTGKAAAVEFDSYDGVDTESLTLSQAHLSDVIVAYRMLGGPISVSHGGPVRLYVAPMYGYKSLKWLSEIRVVEKPTLGFWEVNGYPVDAWIGSANAPTI